MSVISLSLPYTTIFGRAADHIAPRATLALIRPSARLTHGHYGPGLPARALQLLRTAVATHTQSLVSWRYIFCRCFITNVGHGELVREVARLRRTNFFAPHGAVHKPDRLQHPITLETPAAARLTPRDSGVTYTMRNVLLVYPPQSCAVIRSGAAGSPPLLVGSSGLGLSEACGQLARFTVRAASEASLPARERCKTAAIVQLPRDGVLVATRAARRWQTSRGVATRFIVAFRCTRAGGFYRCRRKAVARARWRRCNPNERGSDPSERYS